MKRFYLANLLIWFFLAIVSGCSIVGGGIAGASYDPIWRVKSAERYRTTIATNFTECLLTATARTRPEQHFDDLMRTFPSEVQRVEEAFVSVPNSSFLARYRRRMFELQHEDKTVIIERLPTVFDMHPVRLGMGRLSGVPVVMIANKSRSTSGMYFIGLYTQDGIVLYRCVLRASDVWDVSATENAIDIIGSQATRRLAFKRSQALHNKLYER